MFAVRSDQLIEPIEPIEPAEKPDSGSYGQEDIAEAGIN
jgi:hypothetical protein